MSESLKTDILKASNNAKLLNPVGSGLPSNTLQITADNLIIKPTGTEIEIAFISDRFMKFLNETDHLIINGVKFKKES